jgi:hypothetical protein
MKSATIRGKKIMFFLVLMKKEDISVFLLCYVYIQRIETRICLYYQIKDVNCTNRYHPIIWIYAYFSPH